LTPLLAYASLASTMGSSSSKPVYATNDYELVIKTSKELEHILESGFSAQGKGLHEKISDAARRFPQYFPQQRHGGECDLVRNIRYLATIRNRLIHERGFDHIPDRITFLQKFEKSAADLARVIEARKRETGSSVNTQSQCLIS
jgi:hypothetical protein